MRRRNKPPLPPRWKLPRVAKQAAAARKACPNCGQLDFAVSTREQLTYYGPTKCRCGATRRLRKVERPIDWAAVRERYAIPRDCDIPELKAA
jgi:hypothetical protein